ncbi:hypothetical protein GOP47_0023319 [Adiantum capillus-veneris]|uniref:Uncharacterized protein n=1 Tax=Adiantum capillus-veneris TaxID=13818 RepID=A0A9D4U7I0_ADICA|nr:hypothetical protein GOP47_0023319 [Adiantum capillus-veneris]
MMIYDHINTQQLDLSMCRSHRGLVCCLFMTGPPVGQSNSWVQFAEPPKNNIFIFNPITRACKVLPMPAGFDLSWASISYREIGSRHHHNHAGCFDLALWRSSSTGHFKIAIMCSSSVRRASPDDSTKGLWREGSIPPRQNSHITARQASARSIDINIRPRFQGF